MAYLTLEIEADEWGTNNGEPIAFSYDGECTARISGPAAENGEDQEPSPLDWLNSARVVADPEEDAVHLLVSVGDPRGAFCFTVRRKPDGQLLIHTPRPGESFAHMQTREDHPGTLIVVCDDGETPADFTNSYQPEADAQ